MDPTHFQDKPMTTLLIHRARCIATQDD
ncbi:MAG: hypothetical protein RLZZ95_426, partial [Pseudomonadota bacterium]